MKKLSLLIIVVLGYTTLFASEFKSGELVVVNDPVQSDMYIGAGETRIDAPVFGDLFIGSGEVNINDAISGDLAIGGGDISVKGNIGDDIRIAGGDIEISGNVMGDIILFGGDLTINSDSIGGDVIMFGGDLNVNSHIGGQVRIYAGDATINGSVAGDFLSKSGELSVGAVVYGTSRLVAGNIQLNPEAAFHDNVEYWTEDGEVDFSKAMVSGTATFNKALRSQIDEAGGSPKSFMKWGMLMFAFSLLAGVILIILLHFLLKNLFARSGSIYQDNLLMNFFYGFLFYVVTPIVIIIAFMTVIGIPVGIIIMGCYLIILMLTAAGTSLILANWINHKWDKNWSNGLLILVAIVVLVFLKVINLIPFLGWLLILIIYCAAAGTLIQLFLRRKSTGQRELS